MNDLISFLPYYIVVLTIIVLAYIAGAFIKTIAFPFTHSQKTFSVIYTILLGLTFVITTNAVFSTGGATIQLGYYITGIGLFFFIRKNNTQQSQTFSKRLSDQKNEWKYVPLFLIVASFVFCWYAAVLMSMPDFIFHSDYLQYAKISDFISINHIENNFTTATSVSVSHQKVVPYHYYELWLNNIGLTWFALNKTFSLYLLTAPLLTTLLICSLILVASTYIKTKWLLVIIALTAFIAPVNFLNIDGLDGFSTAAPLYNVKYLAPSIFVFLFLHDVWANTRVNLFLVSCIILTSAALAPSFVGGIILCFFLNLILKRFVSSHELKFVGKLTFAAVLLFMISFYTILGYKGVSPFQYINIDFILRNISLMINILAGSWVYCWYLLIIPLIITVLCIYSYKRNNYPSAGFVNLILVYFSLNIAGVVSFALLFFIIDAMQLQSITMILSTVFVTIIAYMVTAEKMHLVYRILLTLLVLFASIYGMVGNWKYQEDFVCRKNNPERVPQREFMQTVFSRMGKNTPENRVGVVLLDPDNIKSIYDKNIAITNRFIEMGPRGSGLLTINGPDINIDSLNELNAMREKVLIYNTPFYQYYEKNKKENTLAQCRLNYIRDFDFRYGVFEHDAMIPSIVRPYISYYLKDPATNVVYVEFENLQ